MSSRRSKTGSYLHAAGQTERKIVRAIGQHREITETWTREERLAFKICRGISKPTKKYTREWAWRTLLKVAIAKDTAQQVVSAILSHNPEAREIIRDFAPYAFSKETQKVEMNSHHKEEHTLKVSWSKDDPESIARAYEQIFGTPAPLRLIEGGKKT